MSLEEWHAATEPKVKGTWNLHKASSDLDLDFFVLFSSMSGMLGMPGQANYAAGNTFMDAFVQYRHQRHLPASVLDLGAVEGIGHVAQNPQVLERATWIKFVRMSQKELFDAVKCSIFNGAPFREPCTGTAQIITGFRDTMASESFTKMEHLLDGRWALTNSCSADLPDDGSKTASGLEEFIASAAKSPDALSQPLVADFVALEIAKWVFDLLMKPIDEDSEVDISRSLADVGFDSLAAVEMRSWWKRTFDLELSVLEIMTFASFAALGHHAIEGLSLKFWPETS